MHPDERDGVMRNTFSPLQLDAAAGAFARQTSTACWSTGRPPRQTLPLQPVRWVWSRAASECWLYSFPN
jgi:hypothetical protein